MKKMTVRMLTEAGLMIALAIILSQLTIFTMPQAGSISLGGMVPIMLFALRWGAGRGMFVGAVFGLLSFLIKPSFFSVAQVILDYPIAFGALGLAGLAKRNGHTRIPSLGSTALFSIIGVIGRYIAAVTSGVVFFANYAPEGMNPMWYSLTYNATYLLPDAVIALVILLLVYKPVMRAIPSE